MRGPLAVKDLFPSAPLGCFSGQGHFPVSWGSTPRGGPPEDLGKTPIPASPHRSESLDGAWESVCFTYSWKILIRSPALQGGVMASLPVRADGV